MLKRHRSRRARAADLLPKYLKVRATGKAAKGAGKAGKWTAYWTAAKGTAKRAPKKAWLFAGGLGAAAFAARRRRSGTPTTV